MNKEQANSCSDDLKKLHTFLEKLEKQKYSNEAFYLEMAEIYGERGMLDAEEGYHDAGVKKDLYDMELYYVSDKKMEKLLSTQVPRIMSGIYNLPPYAALFYSDSEKVITKYFVFYVDDEGVQLVFENEDLNISYEATKKEFEQFCKTQS